MEGLARSLRRVVGLGMVAAGTTLAAPTGIQVAGWLQEAARRQPASPQPMEEWSGQAPATALPPMQATGATSPLMAPKAPVWPSIPQGPAEQVTAAVPRADYVPPVPPSPLPAVAAELGAAGPDLSGTYRSTLDIPPPPLIDSQRPPPLAVGWTARGANREPPLRRAPSLPPLGTYRVRDGDDLTAIASRFYGTPAAATAIWEANRGLLRDPSLLPIGQPLLLPHPDAIHLSSSRSRQSTIDPSVASHGMPQPGPASAAGSWLDAGGSSE